MLGEGRRRIFIPATLREIGYVPLYIQVFINTPASVGACRWRVYIRILQYNSGKVWWQYVRIDGLCPEYLMSFYDIHRISRSVGEDEWKGHTRRIYTDALSAIIGPITNLTYYIQGALLMFGVR